MDIKLAEKVCARTLELLSELEGHLASLPQAVTFCFESQALVKEIRCIARLESERNITSEQTEDLQRIQNKTNAWLRKVHNA